VLDRLELPDLAAELVPDLGVLGGGLHRPAGDAAGLGTEQDRGQLDDAGPVRSGQHSAGRNGNAVGAHRGQRRGEVHGRDVRHGQVRRVERDPRLAVGGADPRDDQVGHGRGEHRP